MRATRFLFKQATQVTELLNQITIDNPFSEAIARRTHVLHQQLCEDSLQLIRLSLPRPRTCDIIELNPGVGVWSRVLHKTLEPNRHILVEKEPDVYSQWLEPLLEGPDSRYRLTSDLRSAMDANNAFLSPSLIGSQMDKTISKRHDVADAGQETRTLLLTGIMGTDVKASFRRGLVSEAKTFLHTFYSDLFSATGKSMHQYGLVKLLLWVEDAALSVAVPSTVASRTKLSMRLDAASTLSVVAGPSNYWVGAEKNQRWYQLNAEDHERFTAPLRKHSHTTIREERQQGDPPKPLGAFKPSLDFALANKHKFRESSIFIQELATLKKLVLAESPDWLEKYEAERQTMVERGQARGRIQGKSSEPQSHIQFRILLNQLRNYHRDLNVVASMISTYRSLWQKIKYNFKELFIRGVIRPPRKPQSNRTASPESSDTPSSSDAPSPSDTPASPSPQTPPEYPRPALKTRYHSLLQRIANSDRGIRIQATKAIDDYRAYEARPRALAWNNRTFEPLLTRPSDFYGRRKSLSLLSVQPRPSFLTQINTFDKKVCFDHVLATFMAHPTDTILRSARRLLSSSDEADVEKMLSTIPELRDPAAGGWHDWSQLRIRSLSAEIHIKLALAYEAWPRRPSTESLMTLMYATNLVTQGRKKELN